MLMSVSVVGHFFLSPCLSVTDVMKLLITYDNDVDPFN